MAGGGVTVELSDGEQLRARYLVGCDGARSTVRKLLGVAFPGEPSRTETLMGEMEIVVPPEEIAAKMIEIGKTNKRFWLRPFGEGANSVVVPAAGVACTPRDGRPISLCSGLGSGRVPS